MLPNFFNCLISSPNTINALSSDRVLDTIVEHVPIITKFLEFKFHLFLYVNDFILCAALVEDGEFYLIVLIDDNEHWAFHFQVVPIVAFDKI